MLRAHIVLAGMLLAGRPWVFALNPALDVSQYAHTAWKIREGFSKGHIHSIAQTPDGYLWLATEFGFRWRQERPLAVAAGPASALQPDSSPARRARWDSLDWLL